MKVRYDWNDFLKIRPFPPKRRLTGSLDIHRIIDHVHLFCQLCVAFTKISMLSRLGPRIIPQTYDNDAMSGITTGCKTATIFKTSSSQSLL